MEVKILKEIPSLAELEYLTYLDSNGKVRGELAGKIGAYAIFDREKRLQYTGYSRDIYLSLKQHLVRQTDNCYWLKINAIAKPNRTILTETCQVWNEENGSIPPGNSSAKKAWTEAIDCRNLANAAEKEAYQNSDESERIKLLKQIARRIETEIKERLKARGVTEEMRFNPKLKEKGLLDLK